MKKRTKKQPTKFTAKQFIDAIPGSGGVIATIAKRVGCQWITAKHYVENYPTIKQAYENEKNAIDDMAESVVLKSIKDGDVATAKWWLVKKRKSEFGEAVDFTSGGEPVTLRVVYGNDDGTGKRIAD